jgi:GTP-binding protein
VKFIDEAVIEVFAGHGGAGCRSFRREKFVPFGGPNGGNGGVGGSVIMIADKNKHTLLDFSFQPMWQAQNGKPGQGTNKDGKAGEDLRVSVPIGTQLFNADSDEFLTDLTQDGQEYLLAKGGRGGKGNTFFKSATNQVPEYAQPGEEGEHGRVRLSLKLVADVGLIGFPNAGKSTLISRISAAKPKVADYPFTTLVPNLGVVQASGGRSFVVADIPGIIEGAHEGKGLGIQFLKHVERTRVLAHLIDPNQFDENGKAISPIQAFDVINSELSGFSAELAKKPQLVVITKIDTLANQSDIEKILAEFRSRDLEAMAISSVSGKGIPELIERFAQYQVS